MTRKCIDCNKPIPRTRLEQGRNIQTCSEHCATQRRLARQRAYYHRKQGTHETTPPRKCVQCSKPIPRARKRGATYCSDNCSYQARLARRNAVVRAARAANPNMRTCPTCKTMFTPRNSRHTYCTPACNPRIKPRAKPTPRTCANKTCRKTFKARGTQKYCTPACRAPRYALRTKPRPCNTCGEPFLPVHGPERYCSDKCRTIRNRQQAARRAAQHVAERPHAKREWSGGQTSTTISMLNPGHPAYNPRIMGKPVNEQLKILARESDPTFTTWFLEGVADVAGIHELRARILAESNRRQT